MSGDFKVTGADQLLAMSKALKGWDNELRKEMHKGIRDAAKPLIPIVREALRQTYPKRGGLADKMAKSKIRTAYRTGSDPGVTIIIPGLQAKLGEDYGLIRHPVHANPNKTRRQWAWVAQSVDAGAIEAAVNANLDEVIPGIERILAITATRVLGDFKGRS